MELTFEKEENWYVSEFKVIGDFNLHIEKEPKGEFYLYQRTSGDKYDLIKNFGYNRGGNDVIDEDFTALVCPKWIKIKSSVNPTLTVVTAASGNDKDITVSNGVIEYHFGPVELQVDMPGMYNCNFDGDYTEIFNKLKNLIYQYGSDDGFGLNFPTEMVAKRLNITIQTNLSDTPDKVIGGVVYWPNEEVIDMDTDAPVAMGGVARIWLRKDSFSYERGL